MSPSIIAGLAELTGYLVALGSMLLLSRRWSWSSMPSSRSNLTRLILLALIAMGSTVWYYAVQDWKRRTGVPSSSSFSEGWWWHVTAVMGILTALSAVIQTLASQQLAREQQLAAIRLDRERSRAELASLRANINPHLLSGTLAAVRGHVYSDPVAAERGIEQLGNVLRYVLRLDRQHANERALGRSAVDTAPSEQLVTFEEEWEAVEALATLEDLMFARAVEFSEQIDEDVWTSQMPPFSIFPLVEYAFTWLRAAPASSRSQSTARLLVTATTHDTEQRVEIHVHACKSGQDVSTLPPGADASIDAVRQRLAVFSPSAVLTTQQRGSGELSLTVRLPIITDRNRRRLLPPFERLQHVG